MTKKPHPSVLDLKFVSPWVTRGNELQIQKAH